MFIHLSASRKLKFALGNGAAVGVLTVPSLGGASLLDDADVYLWTLGYERIREWAPGPTGHFSQVKEIWA
jgi:hypothetical protein